MNKLINFKFLNNDFKKLKESWIELLKSDEINKKLYEIDNYLDDQSNREKIIYPNKNEIFSCLKYNNAKDIKVVILGQDPYHGLHQAMGLSFSVPENVKIPPSLRNIFKELSQDLSITMPIHGNLVKWAQQGVLLLNTILTVEAGQPGSHAKIGWDLITDAIIEQVNQQSSGCVFMLWGNFAKQKLGKIDTRKHLILESAHPSPLSAYKGFFGNKHFSSANNWLHEKYGEKIDWDCSIK